MATLSRSNGRQVLQVMVRRKRRTIHLGKLGERDARAIKAHVEYLAIAVTSGLPVPMETARWLGGTPDELHAKLSRIGLCSTRQAKAPTLIGDYFDGYIARRTDLKPRTIEIIRQAKRSLVNFFKPARDMSSITKGEARDWQRKALEKFAVATVAAFVKKARQVYADAIERNLLTENPFRAIKAGSMSNTERQVYVTTTDIEKVIAACPTDEWKLLFALARYAGLRVPSETRALRWEDVLWEQNRFRVRSSKTERHEGKATRMLPLFPQLMPYLLKLYAEAEPGAVHVFAKLRGDNLSTTGDKIIARAGLVPWAKTFQNLRSSAETDLAATYPLHVACTWIGNSAAVAMKHYLQVTDSHFEQASGSAAESAAVSAGQERTDTGHRNENPRKTKDSDEPDCPRWEANSGAKSLEIMQAAHAALQKALHRLSDSAPVTRRNLISNLKTRVRQSKAKGGAR
jgi:integrase